MGDVITGIGFILIGTAIIILSLAEPIPTPVVVEHSDDPEAADRDPLTAAATIRHMRSFLVTEERRVVAAARAAGIEWEEIAKALGDSRLDLMHRYMGEIS